MMCCGVTSKPHVFHHSCGGNIVSTIQPTTIGVPMSFTYVGKQKFVAETGHGRIPPVEAVGWLWTDYHENRHVYVRPLGKGQYQLAIFVKGIRTTDEIVTKNRIQTYAENNLGFAIHDNVFLAMDKS